MTTDLKEIGQSRVKSSPSPVDPDSLGFALVKGDKPQLPHRRQPMGLVYLASRANSLKVWASRSEFLPSQYRPMTASAELTGDFGI
ncbi:hypothetical protein PG987_004679 [Apiospora arundinis]